MTRRERETRKKCEEEEITGWCDCVLGVRKKQKKVGQKTSV